MVFGMLTGWAIGSAAMRAALAARNQQVLKASLQLAAQRYVCAPLLFLSGTDFRSLLQRVKFLQGGSVLLPASVNIGPKQPI